MRSATQKNKKPIFKVVEHILKQILSDQIEIKTDIGELKTGQARIEVGQQKLQKNLIFHLK